MREIDQFSPAVTGNGVLCQAKLPWIAVRMLNKPQRVILGVSVLFVVDLIWVTLSEYTKFLHSGTDFEKPFFDTYVKTSMFTVYLLGLCVWPQWRSQFSKSPAYQLLESTLDDSSFYTEANSSLSDSTFVPIKVPETNERGSGTDSGTDSGNDTSGRSVRFSKLAEVRHMSDTGAMEALLARLSYQATVRAGEAAKRAANKFPIYKVAEIAFGFCFLWFIANYTYQMALQRAEAGIVSIMSCTSSLSTLFLAAVFPSNQGDSITTSKLLAVCFSLTSVVLLFLSDHANGDIPIGSILAIISAFFYAAYVVLIRRKVDSEDKMYIPMFFGFVGLWNLVLLWPLFFLLHYSQLEQFEWPNEQQWIVILVNGIVGTVLSQVLWLWGCFLTSSLITSMAMSLTIPMTMFADILLKRFTHSLSFYLGALPIFVSFLAVVLIAYWDNCDPVGEGLRRLSSRIFCCHVSHSHNRSLRISDCESEQQALIGINDGDHEA